MASILRVNTLTDASSNNSTAVSVINQGTAKAWVNFNGEGTIASRDTYNVSGLTDVGTGTYTIAFSNNMGNVNYAPSGMAEGDGKVVIGDSNYAGKVLASSIQINVKSGGTYYDREAVCTTIHGDLA